MLSTNADEIDPLDHFNDFEDEFEEERDRAVREAQREAKRQVPVDTGALRDSISIDLTEDALFSELDYAARINFGFRGRDSLGREYDQQGTYYMTDAALNAFYDSIDRLERR